MQWTLADRLSVDAAATCPLVGRHAWLTVRTRSCDLGSRIADMKRRFELLSNFQKVRRMNPPPKGRPRQVTEFPLLNHSDESEVLATEREPF